jgi:hypothetical protein
MSFQRKRRKQRTIIEGTVQCPVPAGSTSTLLTNKSNVTIKSLASTNVIADNISTQNIQTVELKASKVDTQEVKTCKIISDEVKAGKIVCPNGWSSGVVKDKMAYVKDNEIMMLLSFE